MATDTTDTTEPETREPPAALPAALPVAASPAPSTPTTPGPTFESLFGNVSEVGKGLADLKRAEARENDRLIRSSEGQVARDRIIAQQHYDAAGVEAGRMQPWDAKREWSEVETKPFDSFGSFASVFAIVASAFTHAPLENALNGSAAAMQAIHTGDQDAYERGHTAWKENMDLVQKRFEMQNKLYTDALTLMTHDQAAGRAALQNAAIRFGDQKSIFLLENGMDKELIDLNTARIHQMEAMTKSADAMTDSAFRRQGFEQLKNDFTQRNGREPDANETVQMWNHAHGISQPWQQQLMQQFLIKHQGEADIETKAAKYAQSILQVGRSQGGSVENQWLARWRADFIAKNGTDPTPEDETEALKQFHDARRKTDLKTKAIEETQQASADKGVPISIAEATRQYNIASSVRAFQPAEQRRIAAVPVLMRHLETLDWYANQTGPIKYVPEHIAAVYGGLNDPQQIYEAALKGARTATTELASGGTTLKTALINRLDRLPGNFQDPRFNKRLTQELMQDTSGEARTMLSLLEKGGKSLPPDVLAEYTRYGIYPGSMAAEDPVRILQKDPTLLSDDQVSTVVRYAPTLPKDTQQKLRAEIMRRKALEQQERSSGAGAH